MTKDPGFNTVWTLVLCAISGVACRAAAQDRAAPPALTTDSKVSFGAYYTRIDSGRPFEKYSRTGRYADIVVQVSEAGGRLVFWRGSSYLPYWQSSTTDTVPEVISREGDGTGQMPDRVNTFSHVRLIENTAEQVVVHWRYEADFGGGNPRQDVDTQDFVDEYFTITPDGSVVRTIRQATARIDDWHDPLNKITQTFTLTASGITGLRTDGPAVSRRSEKARGNPIKGPAVGAPVAWWKFDEGAGHLAAESVSGLRTVVNGHKALWKQGVSGTALQFDGYFSSVSLPFANAPAISSGLTLEAWVAIGAYPWNWAPICQQGDGDGYFLGIDGHGYPGFCVRAGGQWLTLELSGDPPYANTLARYRWTHLAGTYDKAAGRMRLYVNGRQVAARSVPRADVQVPHEAIQIGKGKDRIPVDNYKKNATSYSFDGLIDEVKLYDVALTSGQVARSYANFNPGSRVVSDPDLAARRFPTEDTGGRFDARYVTLSYHEAWDSVFRVGEHADIVVGFDELPTRFVFWRGMTYIPHMVNEKGQWYTNEFNETWDNTGGNAHTGDGGVQPWFSDFPAWNHWPISLSESVGRPASFSDRAIHSSLIRANPKTYAKEIGDAPWEERLMLEGMTDLKPNALVALARSWLKSPQLTHVLGATSRGYDRSERAYKLTATAPVISFQIEASEANPIYNPAFVIKNWQKKTAQAALKIDRVPCKTGPSFRQGVIIDTDATYTLVIWLDHQATSTTTFEITDQTADRGASASSE